VSTTPSALSPLEQLEQQSAQAQPGQQASQPTQQAAPSSDLSPLEQLEQMSARPAQQAPPSGEVTNDVGNTVIVPKDGESFADTMKRAAAQGQKTTPDQINREVATMPGKAATVLAAAPAIGAGGSALLAAPGELADLAIKHLAGNVLPGMETEAAKQTLLRAIPTVKQLVGWGLSYEGLKHLFSAVSGGKK
jgi:hypothetical protein